MTNEEKIRSLPTKELAEYLCDVMKDCAECPYGDYCSWGHNGALAWLGRESED